MRICSLILLAGLAACGGDSTAPAEPYRVQGRWRLSATLSETQVTCSLTQVMDLNQSANAFVGAYTRNASCTNSVGQTETGSASGAVANGYVSGTALRFDNDNQNYHFSGTGGAAGMSGTATFFIPLPGAGTRTLRGNWSAVLISQ